MGGGGCLAANTTDRMLSDLAWGGGGDVWQLIVPIGCYWAWYGGEGGGGGGGGDVWQLIVPIGCYQVWHGGVFDS